MNPDYRDILSALSSQKAEFLLVGAYALAVHGIPRATGDIDILVRPEPANAEKIWRALISFGAPLEDISKTDLATPGVVFQIGVAPRRIDIITSIDGVDFEEAWKGRFEENIGGIVIPVIGKKELLKNKASSARPQDLADIRLLEEMDMSQKGKSG